MNGLHILGTGRAVPEQIVTNDDLARRVDTNDEWIVARTGIRERHFAQEGESLTQFTVAAARQALEQAGLKPEDIGLCITATVTPDRLFPSQACLIHQVLGLPEDCPAFDLSAGCTGFLYAMETAAAMLPRMNRPYALLVGGELLSRIVDMDDRSTCILFGDGAGAAVVESTQDGWYSLLGTRGDKDILWAWGPGPDRPYLHMDGQGVFQFALKTVPQVAKQLLEKAGMDKEQVDWYVPHQANHRIVESVAKRLKMPLDRFYENMDRYGNTSAGSIPIALDEMAEKGLLKKGQWVMCLGFGAGLTWGGALFQW